MGNRSWAVTLVPLAIYLLSFGYSLATGQSFTPEQNEMLTNMIYLFLGSGAIGGAVSLSSKLKQ